MLPCDWLVQQPAWPSKGTGRNFEVHESIVGGDMCV